ncbi:hypothetical protein AURDEDRAFT_117309 [Auricularia subglabra TFB-10046 SS5]|nr:hypothetical protein AURDEDRAFT_117309 [Auricularia subglabra TFB-10046 SS5]
MRLSHACISVHSLEAGIGDDLDLGFYTKGLVCYLSASRILRSFELHASPPEAPQRAHEWC